MSLTRLVIITVPPQPLAGEIARLQRRLSGIGGSTAALAWPPHITLRTGALVPNSELEAFVQGLGSALGSWEPFTIRADGLWSEAGPRPDLGAFVGYRIVGDAALWLLNRRLLAYTPWRKSNRLTFEPHLTLAFDDLSAEGHERICSWLKTHSHDVPTRFEWVCAHFGLYALAGRKWQPFHVYYATDGFRGQTRRCAASARSRQVR